MDTFFALLKRGLVGTLLVLFAFVYTYVPQPFNQPAVAHAGGGGFATEATQLLNKAELVITTGLESAQVAIQTAMANIELLEWIQDSVLDGIAWSVAKAVLSGIIRSIVDWINSGFEGSPAFLTDLPGFLLGIADEAIGSYIEELGGLASFICSPFRLDVQISLAVTYDRVRTGERAAPTCTLSGIIDNLEGFIGGLTDFSEGGWNDWFDITARPEMYTPFGAALSAEAGARARLINARGEEVKLLEFGDGFLSGEICELVEGEGVTREDCFISKPGKFIEEQLTFTTQGGQRSLIEADEFNEIVTALLGQLVQTAVTGVAGLLGLSGGTGYSYSGYAGSLTSALAAEAAGAAGGGELIDLIEDARDSEQRVLDLAADNRTVIEKVVDNPTNYEPNEVNQASTILQIFNEASVDDIDTYNGWIAELSTPDLPTDRVIAINNEFVDSDAFMPAQVDALETTMRTLIDNL